MGASNRPIFDQTTDQQPPNPLFPTSVQATGMATAPASTAGFAAGIGGAANAMQNYRDAAVGKLARIHAMIDAGQLPQTALADPSLQPLFHQAGLDQEGHLALLPKISDQQAQLQSDERALPQNQAGQPGGAMLAGTPSASDVNVQTAKDIGTSNPAVAQVKADIPTVPEAENKLTTGTVKSRAGVIDANTQLEDAATQYQVAKDAHERYLASGGKDDEVFRNAEQVAEQKLTTYYGDMMKQQASVSNAATAAGATLGKGNQDFLLGLPARADAALTSRHKDWQDSEEHYRQDIIDQQARSDESSADVKDAKLKTLMDAWNKSHPEPTLLGIMKEMTAAQTGYIGVTQPAATAARANRAGFAKDAGTAAVDNVGLLGNIEGQLQHSKYFTIDAPPGATQMVKDPKGNWQRVPVPAGSRITGTAEMLMNSTDSWVTPAIKAHVATFLKKGNPTLVNDPTKPGSGGGGRSGGKTAINRGGVGQGAQPDARISAPLPPVQ